MNPASERYCRSCGHEAHVARLDCLCPRCATARRRAAAADAPTPLGGVIAEALAALRGGNTPIPSEEVTMSRKRKTATTPDPTPVPRDVPRTPVSAKLAEIIRAMDNALLELYGPYAAFAYHVWIGDGLAAASNATFGFVPPIVKPEESHTEPNGDGGFGNREGRDEA
jgi:hypothetical protein